MLAFIIYRNLAMTGSPNYPSTNYNSKVAIYTASLLYH